MIKKLWFLAGLLIFPILLQGQETTQNRFGKGLINVVAEDSSYSAQFGVRFQNLFSAQMLTPEGEGLQSAETNFLMRRARLKLNGFAYSPKLRYKLQLGLSNRDISGASSYTGGAPRYILDAVIEWNFYENFVLMAGQTKLPGNRDQLISSGNLETVDRSLLDSRFGLGRDMGFQLHHSFMVGENFKIKEAVALSQGEGRNITTGNLGGHQYTGRIEFLPFGDFAAYSGADLAREPHPKLSVGIAFDYNDNAVKTRSNGGNYMITDTGLYETDITTFFADAMFKYRGFSAMAEYANRKAENPMIINAEGIPTGEFAMEGAATNLQAGYLFKNNFQVLGRYTTFNPDYSSAENQYTFGVSKYFVGHKLKVQTDLSYNDFGSSLTDTWVYRLQMELHL